MNNETKENNRVKNYNWLGFYDAVEVLTEYMNDFSADVEKRWSYQQTFILKGKQVESIDDYVREFNDYVNERFNKEYHPVYFRKCKENDEIEEYNKTADDFIEYPNGKRVKICVPKKPNPENELKTLVSYINHYWKTYWQWDGCDSYPVGRELLRFWTAKDNDSNEAWDHFLKVVVPSFELVLK